MITVEGNTREYLPGPAETAIGAGPFGPHLRDGGIVRDGDDIIVSASHLENPTVNEFVYGEAVTGSTTLSKDGEVIDEVDEPFASVAVPKDDSGRYTLSAEATTDTTATALGTKGSAEWEFASKPGGEFTPIDLSSVVFAADNVENGAAPAGAAQKFTLEYLPQNGAAEANAETMTFEVSYDDGKTWNAVDVDRQGNAASGTLEHPAGAECVSYRTTAGDDSGNRFSVTSIRSYALS